MGVTRFRAVAIWLLLAIAVAVPLGAAIASPLLQWRSAVYIGAGFAGIIGLALLLVQPLLIGKLLPGIPPLRARQMHRWTGAILVLLVVLHVGGLWITSPPDVVDALLFRSPTPFSVWGVIAMWGVFLAALVAALRHPLRLRNRTWRHVHAVLVTVIAGGTVVHALLIQGAMETYSKALLCTFVVVAVLAAFQRTRIWSR